MGSNPTPVAIVGEYKRLKIKGIRGVGGTKVSDTKPPNIGMLCNGSTTGFDPVGVGSIPTISPFGIFGRKRKDNNTRLNWDNKCD